MSKKILITSKQFTEMVNELRSRNIKPLIPRKTVYDPFSQFDNVNHTPLMEGIFRTYEPEKIVKFLKKRYGDAAIIQITDGENGEKIFLIKTGDVDSNQEIIDRDMALCGYFPSYVEKRKNERTIQYEPSHQDTVNDKVREKRYVYHLTQSQKIPKILKNGLAPKTNNKKFKYPGRVYFFLSEPSYEKCLSLMNEFYREELRKNHGLEAYEGSYTLLRINTEQLNNVDFSYDPNAEDCVYTYDNIPPKYIEVITTIE